MLGLSLLVSGSAAGEDWERWLEGRLRWAMRDVKGVGPLEEVEVIFGECRGMEMEIMRVKMSFLRI